MAYVNNPNQVPDKSICDLNGRQTYLGQNFIYSAVGTYASTSEGILYLLQNPVSNANPPKAIFQDFKKLTCLTASQYLIFKFYANPTITSTGTSLTPTNLRVASSVTASAKLFNSSNFTVSANGIYLGALGSNFLVPDMSHVLSIFDAGNSLLITAQASQASATTYSTELSWFEL